MLPYFQCLFLPFNVLKCSLSNLYSLFRQSWLCINKIQQDATVRRYLLQNNSTCFGCLSHPSSGVHQTVTAAPGTGHIVWHYWKPHMSLSLSFNLLTWSLSQKNFSQVASLCQIPFHIRHDFTSLVLNLSKPSTRRCTATVRRNSSNLLESFVLQPSTSPSVNAFFRGFSSSAHGLTADPLWVIAWWNNPADNISLLRHNILHYQKNN